MLRGINSVVTKYPKTVIIILLLFTAAAISQMPNLKAETNLEAMFPDEHPVIKYNDLVEEWFEVKDSIVIGVFNEGAEGIYNRESLGIIKKVTDDLRDMEGIQNRKKSDIVSLASMDNVIGTDLGMEVVPFYSDIPQTDEDLKSLKKSVEDNEMVWGSIVSEDGKGAIIMAMLEHDDEQVKMYHKVKDYLDGLDKGNTKVIIAGRPVIEGVFAATMQRDMPNLMRIAILIILAVLFFTFHTLRGVFLPIVLVIITIIWTFGTMAALGIPIYTVMTMMPVILLAVGCADSIHILSKYYDEVIHNPDRSRVELVAETMEELSAPVLMTSVTTIAGFLSLLSSELMPMRYFGIVVAAGIFYALILSLTFLPAMLSLLRIKVSSRKKKLYEEHGSFTHVDYAGRALNLLANTINKRPFLMYIVTFVFILIGGIGLARLNVSASLVGQFKADHPVRDADRLLNSHFGGTNTLNIVVEGKEDEAMKEPAILNGMDKLQAFMEEDPDLGSSISIAEYLKRMNRVLNENRKEMFKVPETRDLAAQYLFLYSMSGDPTDFNSVVDYNYRKANMRFQVKTDESTTVKRILDRADEGIEQFFDKDSVTLNKAGTVTISDAFVTMIVSGQLWSIAISILLIFILTAFEFRSALAGIYCIIPITVSAFFNFGFMGLIGIPLDVSTALTASMAIGIGVDYAIHMVNKYRIEARDGKSPHEVTKATLLTSGRAIWYNALVVALGFLVLLSANLVPQQKLGMMVSLTMMTCFGGAAMFIPTLLNHFKPDFVYNQKKGGSI